MSFRRGCFALVLGVSVFLPALAAHAAPAGWVAAWATALQPIPDLDSPPPLYRAPEVAGRTVRQIVYPTASGRAARIRLSNAYGRAPLVVESASLAQGGEGAALAGGAPVAVRFGGSASVKLAPGQEIESDPVPIAVSAGRPYAISLYMDRHQRMTVWHRVSNQLNYVSGPGDHTTDAGGAAFRTRLTQYVWVSELAVESESARASVAAIGDSITDGLRSSLNRNRRWPDALARRLAADGDSLGVVNLGISGNRLLSDSACYGTALQERFERDALSRSGVKAAILLIGINDINFAAMPPHAGLDCDHPHTAVTAAMLIDGYRRVIGVAHRRGVKVFGATLTPAALPVGREAIRLEVNRWIRGGGAFDGVIDFDQVLRDPAAPDILQHRYDSGDGIHPSDAGYAAMAEAVPIEWLRALNEGK